MRRRVTRVVVVLLLLTLAGGLGATLWLRSRLYASLPTLDGQMQLAGLAAPVTVTRDALGIPTIRASTREDVARATGFVHAQDRFFQMDLARRRAAGELAALVGPRALVVDRETRVHRFRAEARRAVAQLGERDRQILSAYVAGVNAGLAALEAAPFEYLLLRQTPQPWREEDPLLVALSMFLTLQDSEGEYDTTLATMRDVLPPAMVDFLVPPGTEWDSPVDGEAFAVPPIPGPGVYNLRARRAGKPNIALPPPRPEPVRFRGSFERLIPSSPTRQARAAVTRGDAWLPDGGSGDSPLGSNNFAVSGRLTTTGAALVANDMHLTVRVPNTWYRAVYEWPDTSGDGDRHYLIGVTLPGHPAMVIGSNTHVAWGFTNSYGDFSDVLFVDIDPAQPDRYRTPDGWRHFEHHDELIEVAGDDAEHLDVTWTIWGPVIGTDYAGRLRALKWVAHSVEQLASSTTPLESARTLEEAFDEANGFAALGQNMLAADRTGRIGWTIYGSIPRRRGLDGDRAVSWADGTARWDGWLTDAEFPRIIDPSSGRLWTANARVAGGRALTALGHGNFEVGSRARIIRDRLMGRETFSPRDLLGIQLDTSAAFLSRWRDVILRTLTPDLLRDRPERAEFRTIVEHDWNGAAAHDSAAYALTRLFRERVSERVMAFVLAECYEADPTFDYRTIRLREGPIWKLITEQPSHLLAPEFGSWPELLVASVDDVITRLQDDDRGPLAGRVWSEFNVTRYRHPLSSALPLLWRWLDMPSTPMDGDLYTPNMHWGANAPSQRMIVSPGREAEGMMHMPTGQSGHPLSPFHKNSHPAWVTGEPTPLLPGPAQHTLTLVPPA